MARIIYCHPSQTKYEYHVFTDLDFWDARCLVNDLAVVKRNFGNQPDGDEFPTQVVGNGLSRRTIHEIEKRIKKAIISPPRHVIVRSMVMDRFYEFDPLEYYPRHWSKDQMIRFTHLRLPNHQSTLNNMYQQVRLSWVNEKIHVERIQRERKYNPIIRSQREAQKLFRVPSCF
ncbi:hypothetical protein [Desulforhabdus amnigena]|jgi:hypothetical protein|uniref:Uncharacterized protein n=1 Tax=Desulforhabdus amnigena TaxID=40218 RepID=A0A9W6FT92_9BACT|nr:hypothetical protein [Desulforhabdus amnigena]NLJ29618.1 hypothetical protein [Deltaproteobacteria bacterium]GLI32661.1 hypothetical protein DAMNIGENAA_00940 [Desulforhabdus amnigena]